MLDMGFIHDVRKVIALLPAKRQTLFFSATMPPEAKRLADDLLHDPARVAVTPVSSTVESIEQYVYFVDKGDKRALLQHLLGDAALARVLCFTRTKHAADRVADHLRRKGHIEVDAIHGNKSQNNRERALARFKSGASRVLVATDIAARGIDIDDVSHVVNFDLPNVPETYVHRIGRTARAGASGVAISFCDGEERAYLRDIERLTKRPLTVVAAHPFASSAAARPVAALAPEPARQTQPGEGARHPGRPGHAGGGAARSDRPRGRSFGRRRRGGR
jgi:ATP-dependent RNA helicase RhlE